MHTIHITLAAVMSADGRLTNGNDDDTHSWTSEEDWGEFVKLRDTHDALVMEAETYTSIVPVPDVKLLRVVLTDKPEQYADSVIADQLEFTAARAEHVIEDLERRGRKRLLIAGGPEVNTEFLSKGLVDELYLTYEPVLFGAGQFLAAGATLELAMELVDVQQLNKRGTLRAHYKVLR